MPRSPAGVVSPVVITRACAGLFAWPITIVDCGVFQQPRTQFITLGDLVAECISTGAAQDRAHVNRLFERGIALGKELARTCDCLVLAECVPGGTTTAYAVLTLLGYKIAGCVSSSLPAGNHEVKQKLVEAGLKRLKLEHPSFQEDPFAALAAMGDPMQAVVAGMTVAAGATVPVLLAGGSQMLAVYALLTAHCPELERTIPKLAVCTTKWVVLDKSADTLRLSQLVKSPLASDCIDLSKSQHAALRAYEEGHVKEGCGAGAALLLAALSGAYCEAEIIKAIDVAYDELMD